MTSAAVADRPRDDEQRLSEIWASPPGLSGWFRAVQNNTIGLRYILTGLGFFVAGGIQALIMRIQLARPEQEAISPELYNQLFTMHGSTMMFLFAVPTIEAFATYLIPFLVGARDLPFPRLTALGYWVYLFGGVMFQLSFFLGAAPDGGWFAYTPLTGPAFSPGVNLDFWLLGLGVIEVSGIAAAIELIVGILKMRAPGMSLNRIPLFAWSILVMAFMILFAFPAVITASAMLELDRALGTQFFNPALGGDPLLWQHLFWIFGHPDVYIMFIPAAGVISMVIPTFCRRPLAGYTFVVAATVAIGFLSFGLWVHHMFTVGIPMLALSFFTGASLMIAVGSGVQVFAWLATIWHGRVVWRTPFLFAAGFIFNFVLGGITGVMVAIAPFDWQVHDSYFVVAHFHYVLIGGVVFPVLAALYYWFPKIFGRMLSERLGALSFWLIFIGFNVTFFPMHITGLLGMPRRVYTYEAGLGWDLLNLLSTAGAFVLAAGVVITMWNMARSVRRGREAGDNPWDAGTLEWSVSSPPPAYNILQIPVIRGREPLWDGGREPLETADEPSRLLVEDQMRAHEDLREAFTTTVVEARPAGLVAIAGPSYWPLFLAFALMIAFVGGIIPYTEAKIFSVGVGVVLTVVAIVGWLWPDAKQQRSWRLHEQEEALHPLPMDIAGPTSPIWWGMLLYLVAQGTVFSLFVYSYFYLLSGNPTWPPPGIAKPEFDVMGLALAAVMTSAGAAFLAERGIRAGQVRRLRLALGASSLLSLAYLVLQGVEFARLDFGLGEHAYGSIFYVLAGVVAGHVLVALVMSGVVQLRSWLGHFTAQRYAAVQHVALHFYFNAAAAAVAFVTLYFAPYLLGRG
jgi:cytochrome c oxidase subunit I+III